MPAFAESLAMPWGPTLIARPHPHRKCGKTLKALHGPGLSDSIGPAFPCL